MLLLIALVLVSVGTVFAKSLTGPSSSKAPYMTSSRKGVDVKSILTVGDSVNLKPDGTPYRMVGLADGLGAFENEDEGENEDRENKDHEDDDREYDDTFTLLMNHEIGTPSGIVRAHGAPGAFISKWIINKDDLRVIHGEDLIKNVLVWNTTTGQYEEATVAQKTFVRFCSADLPGKSAFYDDGLGYKGRIFMNGEESGVEGRAFAHLMDGTSYELPHLGKFSWENSIANSETGIKTVVAGDRKSVV